MKIEEESQDCPSYLKAILNRATIVEHQANRLV